MRFRIFPILIVAVLLMLTVKLGNLWHGLSIPNSGKIFEKSSAFAQTNDEELTPPPLGGDNEGQAPALDFGLNDGEGDDLPEGMVPADTTDDNEDFSDVSNLSSGEIRLLHDLSKRSKELDITEKRLEEREALLRAAERQLTEKHKSLSIIKGEIEALLAQYDNTLDAENKRLINVYSNMKPKSAAIIFDDMEMDTLLILVRGMGERKLSPIFAAMNPEKVRLLSKEMSKDNEISDIPK